MVSSFINTELLETYAIDFLQYTISVASLFLVFVVLNYLLEKSKNLKTTEDNLIS